MAVRHRLYLVANMGDMQPCHPTSDPSCLSDKRWQFNTNVVFRSDGSLAARYHKYNLYYEAAFDTPPTLELITFDTPFAGRFGVLTCFDILFHDPTVALVEKEGVRQLVYPTAWMNKLPFLATVQYQWAFSQAAKVSMLGANLHNNDSHMTDSGIFSPDTALYHHARAGDPETGKLLVGIVPVLDLAWLAERRATAVTETGLEESGSLHTPSISPSPPTVPFTTSMYDNYTFRLLGGSEGELTACDGPLCCHLQYRRSPQRGDTELYALGAFSGMHKGRHALQVGLTSCLKEEGMFKIDIMSMG